MSKERSPRASWPNDIPAIVLAAGKGSRMKSRQPKTALHVGGRPMVRRVIDALREAGVTRVVTVVGHRADDVRASVGEDVEYVVQEEQLGTGHAAQCAAKEFAGFSGTVLIAHGDIPLLTSEDIAGLVEHHLETGAAATLLTALFEEPGSLGRILRGPDGRVLAIVEARDATPEQLKIKEVNVAVYGFAAPEVFRELAHIDNHNAQRQYYLTDVIGRLVARGRRVEAVPLRKAHAGLGVDTPDDLARAQKNLRTDQAYS